MKTFKSHGHDCAADCAWNLYELIESFTKMIISIYISFLPSRIEKSILTEINVQKYYRTYLGISN